MGKNIAQIFATNPITSIGTANLVYVDVGGVDAAIAGSNLYNASGSAATFNAATLVATTNQLVLGTTHTTTITSPAPAASRVYTIPDAGATASFVMTQGSQTLSGATTFGGSATFNSTATFNNAITVTPVTNQLVLGTTNTATISATAPSASRVYTIPDAGTNSSFLMADGAQTANGRLTLATQLDLVPSTNQIRLGTSGGGGVAITINSALQISGPFTVSFPILSASDTFALLTAAQTFSGSKTFSSALTISPASNQLVLGVTNTATISATAPSASRTYTIPDPGANANFLMSQGAQTVAGVNTFSGGVLFATSGGTPANLNYYETLVNSSVAFTSTAFTGTQTTTFTIVKIGAIVQFSLIGFSGSGNGASPGPISTAASTVLSRFLPTINGTAVQLEQLVSGGTTNNGNTNQMLTMVITTGGAIQLFVSANPYANFFNGATYLVPSFTTSWSVT